MTEISFFSADGASARRSPIHIVREENGLAPMQLLSSTQTKILGLNRILAKLSGLRS
jgi:hypothetical protein